MTESLFGVSRVTDADTQEILDALGAVVGRQNVLHADTDKAPYEQDWRGKFRGAALAVVRPASTEEVSRVLGYCAERRIAVVPQGGNTGLSGGATPDGSGKAIVLSLTRMHRIRSIDLENSTVTVEAGCILHSIQQLAAEHGRLFPLSLAAEGSCTVGGNLATNAGGTAVLRYGNARDLCLGLEVVLADGEVWDGLRALRKDNTGYDLRDLFIGSEGTLGVITAAVLKMEPRPRAMVTALVAVQSPAQALALFQLAQQALGPTLTAFEFISAQCMQAVQRHFPDLAKPFLTLPAYAILVEVSDHEDDAHAAALMESFLAQALEQSHAEDALIAQSLQQSRELWAIRENVTEALQHEGLQAKHDISVPISAIPSFLQQASAAFEERFPDVRMMAFGHMGDGNIHCNVVWSPRDGANDSETHDALNTVVHDLVHTFRGSISAEHGLGQLRRDEAARLKPATEIRLMRAIKTALDPLNLLNPGKVLA